jgi:dihydropteroate synthase
MLDDGADIVDVGGESTRPGAAVAAGPQVRNTRPVSAQEELRRILPVIEQIKRERPGAVVSVDTYKAVVAEAAFAAGAEIVNDVSAFAWDERMAATVAGLHCGAILMHMRGRPEEWRRLEPVPDIVAVVGAGLGERARAAIGAGVQRDHIALDPGFGFGKNFEQNYPLLARMRELHSLGFPLVAGTSRKSFIGRALRRGGEDASPAERGYGTVAAEVLAIVQGAHILRTHDVRACVQAARVADAILAAA